MGWQGREDFVDMESCGEGKEGVAGLAMKIGDSEGSSIIVRDRRKRDCRRKTHCDQA